MFIKKSVLIKEGMFDSRYKCAGDYDFTIRLCLNKYKSIFVKEIFSTYRLGGYSFNATQNGLVFKEVANIYYENYNKLYPLTRIESEKICGSIYNANCEDIPAALASKLRDCKPYFDYVEYLESKKCKIKLNIWMGMVLNRFYAQIKFVVFSPNKFIKKYMNLILHSKLRQSMRRIYYAIQFKKIK